MVVDEDQPNFTDISLIIPTQGGTASFKTSFFPRDLKYQTMFLTRNFKPLVSNEAKSTEESFLFNRVNFVS